LQTITITTISKNKDPYPTVFSEQHKYKINFYRPKLRNNMLDVANFGKQRISDKKKKKNCFLFRKIIVLKNESCSNQLKSIFINIGLTLTR
jgi:3-phenylpropionate/cinnamic acid dioxygenase small subunit